MESGRKIPSEYECPLDDFILKYIVDPLNPYFYNLGATPNILTGISGIFGLLAVYFITKSKYILAGIFFGLSYIFDCFDGNFARKYNMVTKFGDWFDHAKDTLVLTLVLVACFYKKEIPTKTKAVAFTVGLILFILMTAQLGTQEIYYHDIYNIPEHEKSKSLAPAKFLYDLIDGSNYDEKFKYIKHFGCCTFNLYVSAVLMSFQMYT